MIKQIALLQTYIGYIEKGYDIAKKGLNTIGDIKSGHWKLDIDFFNSLKDINPKIAGYSKVSAILLLHQEIAKRLRDLNRLPVNKDEIDYIRRVSLFVLQEADVTVGLLSSLLKDGELKMSDDERITVIDRIYENISDEYHFISSFLNHTKSLLTQRLKETNETKVFQDLTNTKP